MLLKFNTDKDNPLKQDVPEYLSSNYYNAMLKLGENKNQEIVTLTVSIDPIHILLTNSFYIFMTIILTLIILSFVLFGIREYSLSMIKKYNNATKTYDLTDWDKPVIIKHNKEKTYDIETSNKLIQEDSGYTQFNSIEKLTLPKYQLSSQLMTFSPSAPTEIKFKYSIDQLMALNYLKEDGLITEVYSHMMEPNFQKQKISINKLIGSCLDIPSISYKGYYEYHKDLNEIKNVIDSSTDVISQNLFMIKLISISKCTTTINPNIFFQLFVEIMESLIDSNYFVKFTNKFLKVLIVELVLSFSWYHFRFNNYEMKNDYKITKHLELRSLQPFILTRNLIFKNLINFQMNIINYHNFTNVEIEIDLKIGLIIRELINHSHCNDYIGFITILQNSMNNCNNGRNKFFYIEILKLLIMKHKNCCMVDYLNDVNNTQLKSIIMKHGDDKLITDKLMEVILILVKINSNFLQWKLDFKKLNDYKNNSNVNLIPLSTSYTEKFFTPQIGIESSSSKETETDNKTVSEIKIKKTHSSRKLEQHVSIILEGDEEECEESESVLINNKIYE
ncbi:unnamed protein product [Candida verbasci]|uniref:Uncharacterized protein n=1 Tax=Candida verbasci TaxID=1227364 RepID=A0A9W4U1P3_9ASCO|nr:unnamed protein product [Candida verbasci]